MRRIILSFLFLTIAIFASAQANERAMAAAIDTIVRTYNEAEIRDKFVEDIFNKFNKSAYLATRIAKSYYNYNEEADIYKDLYHKMRSYHRNDTAMAFKYIRRAIAIDPTYAKAYVAACDILDYDGQTEEGMKWLEKGLLHNSTDSSLYISQAMILARTDIEAAKAKLEVLRKNDPSMPVDLLMARLYNDIDVRGNQYRAEVAEYFSKVDKSKMTQGDIETYIMSLFYSGQNNECNTQAEEALALFPKSLALNRFYFRSLIPMKKYKEAIPAFNNLKNADKAVIEIRDSINYAAALAGIKKYDEAMALYDIILAKENLSDNDRKSTEIYVGQCMSARVKDYTDLGDFQQAIDMYSAFMDKRRSEGKLDDMMSYTLANIYIDWSAEQNGSEKESTLLKADRILSDAIDNIKIAGNAITFAAVRVFSIYFKLDPTAESGAGIPAIKQYEYLLTKDGELPSGSNATRLTMAYRYMLSYYAYVKSDYTTATAYAEKMLEIDPVNEIAAKFLAATSKRGGRRR